jgi:purine catabolism regulator
MMNEPTSTLNELLRLGYPKKYAWLSDQPASDIQVGWVVSKVGDVGRGDLLVLSGVDLKPEVIRQIRVNGGVAIILTGVIPPVKSMNSNNFPVIHISGEDHLRDVQRTFLNILVNQRAYLMERGVRIHTQLSKIAADGEGLAGLTRSMSELSGRGILIQDKRLGILAEFPSSSLASIWEDVLTQFGDVSHLPGSFIDRKEAGKVPAVLRQELQDGVERVITPISVSGVARGYLSLIDIRQRLDALDYLIAEQGALVCAIEMARVKAVREAEKRLKGDLLTALLQEDITPRDANLWVRRMGLDLDQAHVAIRFAWDAPSSPSLRRLETLVNGEVANQGLKVLVEALGSEILCICQVEPSSNRPEEALNLADAVADMAGIEFSDVPIRSGIGLPAGDISIWRDSFRQAGQALEMARKLDVREPQYFPDLSVYRLLLQLEHHPDLLVFKDEILGSLLDYEGGGDFVKTLEVYFDHNGNLSQAAEALFVHRNTMTYRMERIAEITGLDLNHTETRLAIQLALRIHHMIERRN